MINQHLLKLAIKSSSKESGFTMMEVLVAILVSFAFMMGALQAMAINALLEVKAERQAKADFWIQEDMELVASVAGTPSSPVFCPNNGFGIRLRNILNSATYNVNTSLSSNSVQVVGPNLQLVNKDYRLVRLMSIDNNRPDILQITYRVGVPDDTDTNDRLADNQTGNTSILAENYTEFIHVDALSCSNN